MDTSALVATLTSVMAIGLAIVTARLLRQERQRSDARVAMLASLAAEPAFEPGAHAVAAVAIDTPPLRLEPRTRPARYARPASVADVEILRDAAPVSAPAHAPELFGPAPTRMGVSLFHVFLAAVVLAALFAAAFTWALPASTPAPTSDTTAAIGAPAAPPPLSLVSLRHEQHPDGTLVISGVVRNPPGAAARQRLFAAASLLDGDGAIVATARAPLDFTSLAGGDESPFVVRVSGATGVARYRVGFRDETGAPVAHVDGR